MTGTALFLRFLIFKALLKYLLRGWQLCNTVVPTEGYGATIEVPDPDYPNMVDVTWNQSSVDTFAYLLCVETTAGGKSSEPDTLMVTLKKFCPWDITDFAGTWAGDETGDSETALTVTIEHNAADGDNVLRVKATADPGPSGGDYLPPFLSKVYEGWGERFQTGFGLEGDVLLHIGLLDGSVVIDNDYWGQTLPGPYDYWTGGDGTWSGCTGSMHINFGMYWSQSNIGGSFNRSSTVDITKQ